MTARRPGGKSGAGAARSGLAERIVLVFLVAAVAVLSYVYFHVVPSRYAAPEEPFDLVNPMLDAAVGECVLIETTTMPQDVICLRVREPGVVLRPRHGPARLGTYAGLHRARPYLACAWRNRPSGGTCADPGGGPEDILLFALNGFGMPYDVEVVLDSIRPAWVRLGGRNTFVYEVQLRQYGQAARSWYVHLDPDAPVTGTVLRRHGTERGQVHLTIFTRAPECR